jgi:hypothetical protein
MITGNNTTLEEVFADAARADDKRGWEGRLAHRQAAEERLEDRELDGASNKVPGPAKVRYTHDAMIDMVVENPWVSQGELAKHFGYTEAWVSLIFSSDAFKERLEQRKQELVDPTIRASIDERLRAITVRSLEVLAHKLSKNPDQVPDNLALRAAELGAKGLGIGGNAVPNSILPPNHLESLAQRLLALQPKNLKGEVYEGEIIHVAQGN